MRSFALVVASFVLVAVLASRAEAGGALASARPWIGIGVQAGDKGVVVTEVVEGAPGARAGLRRGDEILAIDGQGVRQPAELIDYVQGRGVGARVTLRLLRGDRELRVELALEARPDELALLRERLIGKSAPPFALEERVGPHAASLSELGGQVVLVEFWATWCGACRESLPTLAAWHRKYAARGLRIVAISQDDDRATLERFARKEKLPFTLAHDEGGKVSSSYRVPAIPMIVVIDRAGVVRFVDVGAGHKLDGVEKAFRPLLWAK